MSILDTIAHFSENLSYRHWNIDILINGLKSLPFPEARCLT